MRSARPGRPAGPGFGRDGARGPGRTCPALAELSPALLAARVLQPGPKRARELLAILRDAPNPAVLHQPDPTVRGRLVDGAGQDRLAGPVAKLDVVLAADLPAGLPDAVIDRALSRHHRAAEVRAAIAPAEGTAGAAMVRRNLIATPIDRTVAQVIAEIRSRVQDMNGCMPSSRSMPTIGLSDTCRSATF